MQNDSQKPTRADEMNKRLDLGRRRVQRNKKTSSGYVSKYVVLPKLWLEANHIEPGDEVAFRMEKNGTLTVRKVGGVA